MENLHYLRPGTFNNWVDSNKGVIIESIKSAATITTLAMGVFASGVFAYRNPTHWNAALLTMSFLSVSSLPSLIHTRNISLIRLSLITNLIGISSLALGGIGAASIFFSARMGDAFKAGRIVYGTFFAQIVATLLGYATPVFFEGIKKGVDLLYHSKQWEKRLLDLCDKIRIMSEWNLEQPFWVYLRNSLTFHAALWTSSEEIQRLYAGVNWTLPSFLWPVIDAFSKRVDIGNFEARMKGLETVVDLAQLQGVEVSEEMKNSHFIMLRCLFQSLDDEDLKQGILLVLEHGAKLIPQVLSTTQFLELFDSEKILKKANEMIEEFLDSTVCWETFYDQFNQLHADLVQLEKDINNKGVEGDIVNDSGDDICKRHGELQQKFIALSKDVEKIYSNKRLWKGFVPLWKEKDQLPFEQEANLLIILHNEELNQQIEDIYRSLLGAKEDSPNPAPKETVCEILQRINGKVSNLHLEEEEEANSALMFLGASASFVQKDYDNLKIWFNLTSPHDLEDAMIIIGLKNEEDLYTQCILIRGENFDRNQVSDRLHNYIKEAISKDPSLQKRLSLLNKQIDDSLPASSQHLREKITRVVFYTINSALVFVPVVAYPLEGAIGFGIGIFWTLIRRFRIINLRSFRENAEANNHSNYYSSLFSQRREADQFVQRTFFGRIRIIQNLLTVTLLRSIVVRGVSAGAVVQSAVATEEFIDLF